MVGIALDNCSPHCFHVSYIPFVGAIVGMVGAVDVCGGSGGRLAFSSLVGSSLLLLRWNVIIFRMAIIQKRDVTCTGRFRGLVFNECHRRPGGNRRHKKARSAGLPKLVPRGFIFNGQSFHRVANHSYSLKYVLCFLFL